MKPLDLYRKFFKQTQLNVFQQEMISEVSNLKVWDATLKEWAGNGYRPESVFKMLQMYDEKLRRGGYDDEPEAQITYQPKCDDCNGIGYIWQQGTAKDCPKCVS